MSQRFKVVDSRENEFFLTAEEISLLRSAKNGRDAERVFYEISGSCYVPMASRASVWIAVASPDLVDRS